MICIERADDLIDSSNAFLFSFQSKGHIFPLEALKD